MGSQRHDFTWLQRVLKQRGVRLTSNELAYELQSKVARICVDAINRLQFTCARMGWLAGCRRSWVVCYPPIAALARPHLCMCSTMSLLCSAVLHEVLHLKLLRAAPDALTSALDSCSPSFPTAGGVRPETAAGRPGCRRQR